MIIDVTASTTENHLALFVVAERKLPDQIRSPLCRMIWVNFAMSTWLVREDYAYLVYRALQDRRITQAFLFIIPLRCFDEVTRLVKKLDGNNLKKITEKIMEVNL